MIRIVMIAAWAVLLVVLLYVWADVRETGANVKEIRRELLRSNLSARAAESFPNFEKEGREEAEGKQQASAEKADKTGAKALKPEEEQVLDEVLTEFLG